MSSIHDKGATPKKPQGYGCLNKTRVTTTPVDIPTQIGKTSQDPTPRWKAIVNSCWEKTTHYSSGMRRSLICYQAQVVNPKYIYIWATLNELSKLYLYIHICVCVCVYVKQSHEFEEVGGSTGGVGEGKTEEWTWCKYSTHVWNSQK